MLNTIIDPCSTASVVPIGMVDMGLVRDVGISSAGHVDIYMRLTSPSCLMVAYFAREATRMLAELPGVTGVDLHPDDGMHWDPSFIASEASDKRRLRLIVLDGAEVEDGAHVHRVAD